MNMSFQGNSGVATFKGVKSDFAFFDDSDGNNGGIRFMVFRLTDNKKLFEDAAENGFQSVETKGGNLKIRYKRVFVSDCSMVTGGIGCRNSIEKKILVSLEPLSFCGKQYQLAKQYMAKTRCDAKLDKNSACINAELENINAQKWDDSPTVIVYGVEVNLGDMPPVVIPHGKVLNCHPAD